MKKQFKFFMQLGLVLCSMALFSETSVAAKKSGEETLDKIVAIVDNSVITQSELDKAIDTATKQIESENVPLPPTASLHKQVLDQLVNRKLQLQYAEQANVHVNDADVTKAIEKIAAQNHATAAELYQRVTEQGLTKADYRKEIHDEMVIQEVEQQEVSSKINVTPEEVKNFIHSKAWQTAAASTSVADKEYRVEDTLITIPENATQSDIDAIKTKAIAALADLRLKKTVAGTETTNLGWQKLNELPSAFVNTVAAMKQNQFADPIQTANGFHILHLIGIQGGSSAVSAPTDQEAQQMLFQKKFETALKDWIRKLRSGASINLHPDN